MSLSSSSSSLSSSSNNFFHIFKLSAIAFLSPIILFDILERIFSLFQEKRKGKRLLLSKYSIIDEDLTSTIDLPATVSTGTWTAIGLQRPMVIAMVTTLFSLFLDYSRSFLTNHLNRLVYLQEGNLILLR